MTIERAAASRWRDLTGRRFGRLVVSEFAGIAVSGGARWLCQCDCGNTITTTAANLKNGSTISCRCALRERGRARFKREPNRVTFVTDTVVSLELTDASGVVVGATLIDYDMLSSAQHYRWGLHNGYAHGRVAGKMTPLHKFVFGADISTGYEIDHISRDTLDNRRSNLRFVTHQQNTMNSGKQSNNTSGYIGVTWCKREKKWRAIVMCNKVSFRLGYFSDPVDAARVRDAKARELHGEFAVLNFPAEALQLTTVT